MAKVTPWMRMIRKESRRVIVITGTPGVGKTSISKLLASKLGTLHIDLGRLVKDEGLFTEIDVERDTLVADIERVSRKVKEIIESSDKDVIVEGHFAVDVIPPEIIYKVFVLRRHPEELRAILERRGFREGKVWENVGAEVLDVCLYEAIEACGIDKVCEVDATGRSMEDVVDEMTSILSGEKKCRAGFIDWLGRLEAEGKLEEYLRHF